MLSGFVKFLSAFNSRYLSVSSFGGGGGYPAWNPLSTCSHLGKDCLGWELLHRTRRGRACCSSCTSPLLPPPAFPPLRCVRRPLGTSVPLSPSRCLPPPGSQGRAFHCGLLQHLVSFLQWSLRESVVMLCASFLLPMKCFS